jgi:glycosyltransferase involved in cell wall biosynthesis
MIDVLVPTYDRAERLRKVWTNIAERSKTDIHICFIVEPDDYASLSVIKREGFSYVLNQGPKSYAGAVNTAYALSDAEYLFCGSDDLNFSEGWDLRLLAHVDPWFAVFGTNDLFNPYVLQGSHATHYLVKREYLDKIGGMVDAGPGSFLNPAYSHNYTDTEFIWTAKARAKFKPVLSCVVEHTHWAAKKASKDATYLKGEEHVKQDEELYLSRRHLWMDISR